MEDTRTTIKQVLGYVSNYNIRCLSFKANDIILHIYSDTAYLILPKIQSLIASLFRLLSKHSTDTSMNGVILIKCYTLCHVITLAAETEI